MSSTFGRLDPVGDRQRDSPDDPPLSPAVVRQLHAELLRQKRRSFLKSLPLLAVAAALLAAAARDPSHLGGLAMWAVLALGVVGLLGYQWMSLRRADPMRLFELEQQREATRRVQLQEHALRSAEVRPAATLALSAAIVVVTLVQFWSGPLQKGILAAALVKPAVRAGEWWRLLTASYMHGSLLHLVSNLSALTMLGALIETYDRRLRVPLVYLAAAIGGNLLSTLLSSKAAVGASGGVLGLAGYLLVVAGRDPGGAPEWIREQMWRIIGPTAVMGLVAFFFIDNAAHAGGVLTGMAIGALVVRPTADPAGRAGFLDSLGWAATVVLATGALFTAMKLVQ